MSFLPDALPFAKDRLRQSDPDFQPHKWPYRPSPVRKLLVLCPRLAFASVDMRRACLDPLTGSNSPSTAAPLPMLQAVQRTQLSPLRTVDAASGLVRGSNKHAALEKNDFDDSKQAPLSVPPV